MGVPAPGKAVALTGMNICRFVGGKIAETWEAVDVLKLLQQLGAAVSLPRPTAYGRQGPH